MTSRPVPCGPVIPGSINNTTSYSRLNKSQITNTSQLTTTSFTSNSMSVSVISGLSAPTHSSDAANKAYVDSRVVSAFTEYLVQVQKDPGSGEFLTIELALASITDASVTKPYCVQVGPGIYDENELVVPAYVSVKGASIATTIVRPVIANQYLFKLNTNCEISFMTLQGIAGSVGPGAGAGYSAVYCEDVGDFAQMHKISIYDFDIGVENYSNTAGSILYVEYTDVSGYNYAFKNRSGSIATVYLAHMFLENVYTFQSDTVTKTAVINDGINTSIHLLACYLYADGIAGMTGIVMQNGGQLNVNAASFTDFTNNAIISRNVGAGATIYIDGTSFVNCTLDFSIENADTTGYFFGNSQKDNHYIIPSSTFFIANEDLNVIDVSERGGDFTSIKTAIDSITDATITNPYIVNVGPGLYVEDTITMKTGVILAGASIGGTIITPSVVSNTIMVGSDNSLVKNVTFSGATGGKAVYFEGAATTGFVIYNCGFTNCGTMVHAHGASLDTNMIVRDCNLAGSFTTGFLATNVGSVLTRLSTDGIIYTDLVLPVCTYLASVSGTNVVYSLTDSIIRVAQTSASTGIYVGSGAEIRILGSSLKGFGKTIHVPTGALNTKIFGSGVLIDDSVTSDILIEESSTTGVWQGSTEYTKVTIPLDSAFYVYAKDITLVSVQNSGGDFTSIVSALASITQNSSINRFVIQVGPGTYTEPEIVMKPYVSIVGNGRTTVIIPDGAHHIVRASDYTEIVSCILTGAQTGYAAIYHDSATGTLNTSFIARDMLFGINDIHCWAYGNLGSSHIIIFSCRFGGTAQFNYGFRATNNNNEARATITMLSSTSQEFTSPLPAYIFYAHGHNCVIEVNGLNVVNNSTIEAGSTAFSIGNGGHIHLVGVNIQGFDTGISVANTGTAPELVTVGSSISNCNNDLVISHPDTYGSVDISASRLKTTIDPLAPISVFIVDPTEKGIAFAGPFYYDKQDFGNITDISSLITDTPTMGLIDGGVLSVSSGLTLAISAGEGYLMVGVDPTDYHEFKTWTNSTLSLTASSNLYIYMNTVGTFVANSSYPDTTHNILLGKVSTNATDIIYIQKTPVNAHHYSNNLELTLKNGIGPIYSNGSSVAETGTRQLNISSGLYYFTNTQFIPDGANPATWTSYYRSAVAGVYTPITAQSTVPNDKYDDGSGTLANLTASYYTKHLLVLLGGPSEVYALIYGQTEYISQGAAETAGLPQAPSFVSDAFVNVVSIVVQQGATNIISFIDERPRIGFASSSVTGAVTIHGNLLGLSANDHPQYLLVDGSAPGMLGDLDMNLNNITNVGLFNGFDVSAHASRHAFNGADPLTPALTADLAEISDSVAFQGVNNTKVPRAYHQHAHGNRGGGSLHATATTTSAGFISAANQLKLNGIADGATNTTLTTTSPLNVTKSAAVVGTSLEVARADHKHDIDTTTASGLLTTSTSTEGSSTYLARADHTHAISSAVVVQQIPDQTNAIGNSTAFARADHIHNIPSGVPVSLNANSTTSQGAASTFAISNHSHAISSSAPSLQTIATANFLGVSTAFARADHIHTFSAGTPSTISTTNSEGTSVSFARADHIHNHGTLAGGTLHADVIAAGASGFMTGADKTKLDNIRIAIQGSFANVFGTGTGTEYIQWGQVANTTTTTVNTVLVGQTCTIVKATCTFVNLTGIGGTGTATFNIGEIPSGAAPSTANFSILSGGTGVVVWDSVALAGGYPSTSSSVLNIPITTTTQLAVNCVRTANITPANTEVNMVLWLSF